MIEDPVALAMFAGACVAAASSGAIFKPDSWYRRLPKPAWTPPDFLFPIAWTILFAMMAYAAYLVWMAGGVDAIPILAVFGAHLGVNAAWSFLFFGRKRIDLALADVAVLWAMILVLMIGFAGFSRLASLLLAPYLVWVSFAALLNAAIWRMNRRVRDRA